MPIPNPATPPPSRILLLRWGDNATAKGNYKIGLRTLAASRLWDDLGYGEVAVDFEHNTVPGHPSYKGEPAPIAAMAGVRVEPGVGLVLQPVDWTPQGLSNRGNYPDYSPAVVQDESGEVIFIHSAALCRNGAVHGLHALSAAAIPAKLSSRISTLAVMPSMVQSAANTDQRYETNEEDGGSQVNMPLLRQCLGLPPDATDEEVDALLEAIMAGLTSRDAEGNPALQALSAASLQFTPAEREVMRHMRLSPAEWIKHNGLARVQTLTAAPVRLDDATQKEVNRRLGISDELWRKYHG